LAGVQERKSLFMIGARKTLWQKKFYLTFTLLVLALASIATSAQESKKKDKDKDKEKKNAAPTVTLTAATTNPSGLPVESIFAAIETQPVLSTGDAADDPAIWVNPDDASMSTIIGTNKQAGLAVYDLSGKELQFVKAGQINNVDIRRNFKLGGEQVALVAGGNRASSTIVTYKVNPKTRMLEDVAAQPLKTIAIYGSCLYTSPKTNKTYFFATSKTGDVEQLELFDNGSGKVDAKRVRSFKVGGVIEGCVADDELGSFYVSEEAVGLWKYSAEPDGGTERTQIDKVGGNLAADVEGVTIAYGPNGTGYVIVSSQGNHTFVVYKREGNNPYVKTFRVAPGENVDGVEETDGIDVFAGSLGPQFPHGVFVAQDGYNDKGNQNFKLVPLERVLPEAAARQSAPAGR